MTIYKDQLEAVYKLIEKPENWTQGAYARRADGTAILGDSYVCVTHTEAHSRCIFGAGMACDIGTYSMSAALHGLSGQPNLASWNDAPERTHAEVLALLKSAIERAPVRP
jgi:hypothetical protein